MIILLLGVVLSLAAAQPAEAARWVWSLYDSEDSVALALEVPDTDRLRAVLECEPRSGVARVTVYGPAERPEYVTLAAGEASAASERVEADGLAATLRLDHPVFRAFAAGGRLTVSAGDSRAEVVVPAADRPKLNRFGALCGS